MAWDGGMLKAHLVPGTSCHLAWVAHHTRPWRPPKAWFRCRFCCIGAFPAFPAREEKAPHPHPRLMPPPGVERRRAQRPGAFPAPLLGGLRVLSGIFCVPVSPRGFSVSPKSPQPCTVFFLPPEPPAPGAIRRQPQNRGGAGRERGGRGAVCVGPAGAGAVRGAGGERGRGG